MRAVAVAILALVASCDGRFDGTYTMHHRVATSDPGPTLTPVDPVTLDITADVGGYHVDEDGTSATDVVYSSDGDGSLSFTMFEGWGSWSGGVPISAHPHYVLARGGDGLLHATGTDILIFDIGGGGTTMHCTVTLDEQ